MLKIFLGIIVLLMVWGVVALPSGWEYHWVQVMDEANGIYPQKWVLLGYFVNTDSQLEPVVVRIGGQNEKI